MLQYGALRNCDGLFWGGTVLHLVQIACHCKQMIGLCLLVLVRVALWQRVANGSFAGGNKKGPNRWGLSLLRITALGWQMPA